MRKVLPPLLLLLLGACAPAAPPPAAPEPRPALVYDTAAARSALAAARDSARASPDLTAAERLRRMTRLGMWSAGDSLLASLPQQDDELRVARAELLFRRHRYPEAERLVDSALARAPQHRAARLLQARLLVQAWELERAERSLLADGLLSGVGRDEERALLGGRIHLLRKEYDRALRVAQRVQRWNPGSAGAHLLEADTRFWARDPEGAEAPLALAVGLDPWNADARFALGYALWRRGDARQLPLMAAQWALALEANPLHYETHWHWGNGHTHLTYADYAQPEDSTVRVRLARVDSLLARSHVDSAVLVTRTVEREFPGSVLAPVARGSAWYLDADGERRTERLDSAEAVFRDVLRRKPHYGPAHNSLAAVIKKRQVAYLARADSLEAAIRATPLPEDPRFFAVFRDAADYPGDRVQRMARQQIGPTAAYVPLLHRLGLRFTIPPLHQDLAQAMGNPFFRTGTTFDNRQWMDIRGVGGGAAGIEYVERGSHQERGVLLHEYVHLFHTTLLTDAEQRRIRALYHDAARRNRFLDYYAANNEHEFFAQGVEALLAPVKVHPLNHKAMNTRSDLRTTDPAQLAFLEGITRRQRAYLAGDTAAFRSNWAQGYVTLAERARGGRDPDRLPRAAALLDTALVWDAGYLPAMVRLAAVRREQGRTAEADEWLRRAEASDAAYAPVFRGRAELAAARGEPPEAQEALLRHALTLEDDLAERAELHRARWTLLARHARTPEAIRAAEAYADSGPALSTYLRDRRDEAAAFALGLRAAAGYATETLPAWAELVARKPQHYGFRAQYAEALAVAGRHAEALATLEEGQRILRAAGTPRPDYMILAAEIELLRGDTAAAGRAAAALRAGTPRPPEHDPRWARVLAGLGDAAAARDALAGADSAAPAPRAEAAFTRGVVDEAAGQPAPAEGAFRAALAADPGHPGARLGLIRLLARSGRTAEARQARDEAARLPFPLGPDFRRDAEVALAAR